MLPLCVINALSPVISPLVLLNKILVLYSVLIYVLCHSCLKQINVSKKITLKSLSDVLCMQLPL